MAEITSITVDNLIDYSYKLNEIHMAITDTNTLLRGIASILIFFVIVMLCRYAYKLFNMFF